MGGDRCHLKLKGLQSKELGGCGDTQVMERNLSYSGNDKFRRPPTIDVGLRRRPNLWSKAARIAGTLRLTPGGETFTLRRRVQLRDRSGRGVKNSCDLLGGHPST